MNLSSLTMAGFKLVDSPMTATKSVNTSSLNLQEFEMALPMVEFYCEQMSLKQYGEQGKNATKHALKELIDRLSKDGSPFFTTLRKRKQEEIECSGFIPFLKARLLSSLQGNAYQLSLLSDVECERRLEELHIGIMKAFEYDQEEKLRHYSKRLTEKQSRQSAVDCHPVSHETEGARDSSPPPLPCRGNRGSHKRQVPPPPPKVNSPLKDIMNVYTLPTIYKRRPINQARYNNDTTVNTTSVECSVVCDVPEDFSFSNPHSSLPDSQQATSTRVLTGVQDDFCFSNPFISLPDLKQASVPPRDTPERMRHLSCDTPRPRHDTSPILCDTPGGLFWDNPLDSTEPLGDVLLRVIDSKFDDVHASSSPQQESVQNGEVDVE